jgi:transcriptional regulator with XRE-family HTH domain
VEQQTPEELFGKNLRRVRSQASLTQMLLAERAHLDHAVISRLESGRQEPRLKTILRLAAALEVSTSDLLEGVELPHEGH